MELLKKVIKVLKSTLILLNSELNFNTSETKESSPLHFTDMLLFIESIESSSPGMAWSLPRPEDSLRKIENLLEASES